MKFPTKYKAGLIAISFAVCALAGLSSIYLQNPIWIAFCLINIVAWSLFGLFLFIIFLVEYIKFKAEPELTKENVELQERIVILEAEKRQLEREAERITQESKIHE